MTARLARGLALCLAVTLALRLGGVAATAYYSLFRWLRSDTLEYTRVWQYGLPLLDPRFAAALAWAAIYTAFLVLVLVPLARWLERRLPTGGVPGSAAMLALALGLGTRGFPGPLLIRGLFAAPASPLEGGVAVSWLDSPAGARVAVALAEAWWQLPLMVLILRLWPAARGNRRGWLPAAAMWALLQPAEAPYLITAGGPSGATMNLQFLAFHEGFGRQEFGYAAVLMVLLVPAAGALAWVLNRMTGTGLQAPPAPVERPTRLWWLAPACLLTPALAAWLRQPPAVHADWSTGWIAGGLLVLAGSGWTLACLMPAERLLERLPRWAGGCLAAAVLLPGLSFVIPLTRASWERGEAAGIAVLMAGMILAAPALVWAWPVWRLTTAFPGRGRCLATLFAAAWGLWTEGLLPLMLSRECASVRPAPAELAWELSTHLRTSPLSYDQWPGLWVGGTLLAWACISRIMPAMTRTADTPAAQ